MAARALWIGAAKYGLPLVALATLGAVFVFSGARYDDRVSFDSIDVSALGEGLKLTNPRFTGATSKGEPFTVTAEWALPDGPRPEKVELSNVTGEINLSDGRYVEISALSGLIEPQANILSLIGSVRFKSSDGYEVRAASARLDAKAGVLTGGGPVKVTGPLGRIDAGSVRVERDGPRGPGDYIRFENRVKVRIDDPKGATLPE